MNKNILWFVSFAWACVTFFSFLNQFGGLHKFFSLISFYPNFDRKSYINSPARLTKAVWLKLPQLLKQFINFSWAFALSRYTGRSPLKSVSPVILARRLTLKPHFTCFKKGKVLSFWHQVWNDTRAVSKTRKCQTANKLEWVTWVSKQHIRGPWQVYEWGREGVWVYCGLDASNPTTQYNTSQYTTIQYITYCRGASNPTPLHNTKHHNASQCITIHHKVNILSGCK